MSEDENEQIARAMALSLQGLESELAHEEQEQLDLKAAIAASLGKTVDQLTARDMLLAETPKPNISNNNSSNNNNKRKREEELSGQHRVIKRFDNSNTLFWDGIVKLTYVQGFVGPDYIRFQDIINKVRLSNRHIVQSKLIMTLYRTS